MPKIYFEEKGPSLVKLRGMTKTEFAARMGVRKQNVNALFKSKNLLTIRRAAEVLCVPFEMLTGYVTEPGPENFAPLVAETDLRHSGAAADQGHSGAVAGQGHPEADATPSRQVVDAALSSAVHRLVKVVRGLTDRGLLSRDRAVTILDGGYTVSVGRDA